MSEKEGEDNSKESGENREYGSGDDIDDSDKGDHIKNFSYCDE